MPVYSRLSVRKEFFLMIALPSSTHDMFQIFVNSVLCTTYDKPGREWNALALRSWIPSWSTAREQPTSSIIATIFPEVRNLFSRSRTHRHVYEELGALFLLISQAIALKLPHLCRFLTLVRIIRIRV